MSCGFAEAQSRFFQYLRSERNYSDHTLKGYRRDLERFAREADLTPDAALASIDALTIRGTLIPLRQAGLSAKSMQRYLSSLRSFFRYCLKHRWITQNPASDIKAPKTPRALPKTLDVDQTKKLLDTEPGNSWIGSRDLAMMELLYSSGMRVAELCSLTLQDVSLSERTARVTGKGNKTRMVPVGHAAVNALKRWLNFRQQIAAADETHLFVGKTGRALAIRSVQKRLELAGIKLGSDQRLHPHLFRHSFASHLLESSGDLRSVQEMLGHANLSTTQIYTHLDFQHLAKVYDQAHPRATRKK